MNIDDNEFESLVTALVTRHSVLPRPVLSTYLGEIVNWNHRVALVSRRSTISVLERLVGQSVRLWELVEAQREQPLTSFVDIGSGAGFPGIIWKMMSPAAVGFLVERREKKATFLEHVVHGIGFADIEVYAGDARDAARRAAVAEAFDVAATLAVATPQDTIPMVRPFLKAGGMFATIVGSSAAVPTDAAGMRLLCSEHHRSGTLSIYQDPQ